ncbi:MAG: cysteine peptidase family C39 domain-containing protein [Methylococcales bacterium]
MGIPDSFLMSSHHLLTRQLSRVWLSVIVLSLLANPIRGEERKPVESLLEMRRENVVIQEWDLSCGAATLAILLNFQHGDFVSEREIAKGLVARDEYIDNPHLVKIRHGFSLLDLKQYVDGRGYTGVGYGKLKFKDLLKRAPIMVPINTLGYNHFVIFRGKHGNRVLLADPAWGNRTMLIDRFKTAWIDYPELGRIGFVVNRLDGVEPPNTLAPSEREFLTLQ